MGDQVLSRDPATGKDEAKTVTFTIELHAPSVVGVTMRDARTGKAETLTCTPEHPLFVQGQGWVEAGSVGIGTSIVSRAGPALQVTNLTWEKNKAEELAAGTAGSSFGGYTVYNLTIEDDHTFFVGTANGGTWVHNVCPYALKGKSFPKSIEDMQDLLGVKGTRTSAGRQWDINGWKIKAEAHGPEYDGRIIPGHGDLHFHIEDPTGARMPSGNAGNPGSFLPGQTIPTEW